MTTLDTGGSSMNCRLFVSSMCGISSFYIFLYLVTEKEIFIMKVTILAARREANAYMDVLGGIVGKAERFSAFKEKEIGVVEQNMGPVSVMVSDSKVEDHVMIEVGYNTDFVIDMLRVVADHAAAIRQIGTGIKNMVCGFIQMSGIMKDMESVTKKYMIEEKN